ncbi:MAG: methionine--tRNA ligase subunit beta [Bacteroidia bacterium]|nr:methionine--tRNA ligase subunit beta [Bacteroidia bacterium]
MPASGPPNRTLVTAALIYANGPVHIGHLAGCYLPADIYVRYLRSRYGADSVLFVSGTDEHGVAITLKARAEGKTPQQVLDQYYPQIKATFVGLGISFDVFSQTHGAAGPAPLGEGPVGEAELPHLRYHLHTAVSQGFFSRFVDQVADKYRFVTRQVDQFYDPEAQQFLADRYIVGTCPVCANPNAYGDQCERCGSTLSPDELIGPRSTLSGATPVKRPTTHWYLPLDSFQPWLEQYIEGHASTWKANVVGQCRSWLQAGLKPRAMTRDLDWGVPVPATIPGHEGKVLYVWFDAPLGYISATQEWARQRGTPDAWRQWWLTGGATGPASVSARLGPSPGADESTLTPRIPLEAGGWGNLMGHPGPRTRLPRDIDYGGTLTPRIPLSEADWGSLSPHPVTPEPTDASPATDQRLVHFIGKDNIVFHGLIFPAMLHAHGGYVVPTTVAANEFMNLEGDKISTSRNWAVWAHEYLEDFAHYPLHADMLRYYLTAIAPEQKDSDFSWKDFQKRVNDDLVGVLGNFINRVLVLASKGLHSQVPSDIDPALPTSGFGAVYAALDDFRFKEAQEAYFAFVREGNQLLSATEPWKLDTNSAEYRTVLYQCLQLAALYAVLVEPFLPATSERLKRALNLEGIRLADVPALRPLLAPGHQVGEPFHLFKRIEDADIERQLAKLAASKAQTAVQATPTADAPAPEAPGALAPFKPVVEFSDFEKLDLRLGTVVSAVPVPKTDKLLKLTVDLGHEVRTIVSGIAEHYRPDQLVGQQVVVVANLAPRKLRGIESQGMILLAEAPDGALSRLHTSTDTLPPGSVVR